MLDILLLGVIHQYQFPSPWSGCDELEKKQRKSYSAWVRGHLQKFKPQLIADETALNETDDKFADTGIPWMHIDIPKNVREKCGLSEDPRPTGREWIPEIDNPREEFWLCIVEQVAAACRIDKILVLCGAAHLKSFGDKLRTRGHQVSSYDLMDEDWYDASWFK